MVTQTEVENRLAEIAKDCKDLNRTDLRLFNKMTELDRVQMWPTDKDILRAQNALSMQDGTSGGYVLETHVAEEVVETGLVDASIMRREANVVAAVRFSELFPILRDGTSEGRIISEDEQATETNPEFGAMSSPGYVFSSDMVKASYGLVQDSRRLPAILFSALSKRVGRRQNRAFTVGTGGSQPLGITNGVQVGVTCAATDTITVDEVIDLTCSLDSEYLNGRPALMMSPTTFATLRKLKDTANLSRWIQAGLDKYRLVLNSHMPAPAAGTKPIVFGDIKRCYTVREHLTEFQSLTEAVGLADNATMGFLLKQVADGFVHDSYACKSLKMAAS